MMKNSREKFYEIGYHLTPEILAGELSLAGDKVKTYIEKLGGVIKSGDIKKVRLAYPIKKRRESYFGFSRFNLDPANLEKLKNNLKLDKEILRFLIISLRPKEAEQAPLAAIAAIPSFVSKKAAAPTPEKKQPEISAPKIEAAPKKSMEELDKTLQKLLGEEPKT